MPTNLQEKPSDEFHTEQARLGEVTIENPVPYAAIHNDGGDITTHPTVSPKMRRFAWHMAYSLAGVKGRVSSRADLPEVARLWKCLALTKKDKITVKAQAFHNVSSWATPWELQVKVNKTINDSLKNQRWNYFFIKSLIMSRRGCQSFPSLMKTMGSWKTSITPIPTCTQ